MMRMICSRFPVYDQDEMVIGENLLHQSTNLLDIAICNRIKLATRWVQQTVLTVSLDEYLKYILIS